MSGPGVVAGRMRPDHQIAAPGLIARHALDPVRPADPRTGARRRPQAYSACCTSPRTVGGLGRAGPELMRHAQQPFGHRRPDRPRRCRSASDGGESSLSATTRALNGRSARDRVAIRWVGSGAPSDRAAASIQPTRPSRRARPHSRSPARSSTSKASPNSSWSIRSDADVRVGMDVGDRDDPVHGRHRTDTPSPRHSPSSACSARSGRARVVRGSSRAASVNKGGSSSR